MTAAGHRALLSAVDYHTAGEPFRIVTGGFSPPAGPTVADRRLDAAARLDGLRQLLVHEPRGHAGMYGCFPTPPDDDGAVLGAVFFHLSGFSTACGHGTIALATWAFDTGLVAGDADQLCIDVPSGRVAVTLHRSADGDLDSVGFLNVPAWVEARDVSIEIAGGSLQVDVAFGGAFYASVPASALRLQVSPDCLPQLVGAGRDIQRRLQELGLARHPHDPRLSGIYGVTFYEDLDVSGDELGQRNVTIFGDGQVDRSPCGSGTTARLALLHGRQLAPGQTLRHESIIGTRFDGRVVAVDHDDQGRAVFLTEVRGRASLTGLHQFVLDPRDPLGNGFALM